MTSRIAVCMMLVVVLGIIAGNSTAQAQIPDYHHIWLRISDTGGGLDTLVFGVNTHATYGVDTSLGEQLAPPPPPSPGPFYACWQDVGDHIDMDQGLKGLDLRHYSDAHQIDTFHIYTVPGTPSPGPPVTITWPDAAYLAARCDSIILENPNSGALINMIDVRSYTITSRLHKDFFIYRYGAYLVPDAVKEYRPGIPDGFSLQQNYPNPFNPSTSIKFEIQKSAFTSIVVFDVLGRTVSTLVAEQLSPGFYSTTWNGQDDRGVAVPSGLYFARMTSRSISGNNNQDTFSAVRKLVLVK